MLFWARVIAKERPPDYAVAVSTVTEIKQAVSKLPARRKLALAKWLQKQVNDRLNEEEMMAIAAEGARRLDQRDFEAKRHGRAALHDASRYRMRL
jgi:hypothetical protein